MIQSPVNDKDTVELTLEIPAYVIALACSLAFLWMWIAEIKSTVMHPSRWQS